MFRLLSTIKGRLVLSSLLTAVLTLAAIGTTMYMGGLIKVRFDTLRHHINPLVDDVNKMTNVGLEGGSQLRTRVMAYDLNASKVAALKALFAGFDEALTKAQDLARDEPPIEKQIAEVAKAWKPVKAARMGILNGMQGGDYSTAINLLPKADKDWQVLHSALQRLNHTLETKRLHEGEVIAQTIRNSWIWGSGLLLSALILGGGFMLLTIIGTVRRIDGLLKTMEDVGAGEADLSRRLSVKGRDEMDRIAAAFNRFVERIQEAIGKVAQSAEQVSASSNDMSASSGQIKAGAEQQRMDTEQVAAAINEMSATSQEVARNIEQTSGLASKAAQSSQAGAQRAASAMGGMESLTAELMRSGQAVEELNRGVSDIGSIVDLINQIAEQTNLLALNAAIEAARAGEQGRGFAVVADEVRSLAQKTQGATAKISEMIERVGRSAGSVVDSMGATQERSKSAVAEVELVAEALSEVVGMVHDIADRAAQIATAAEQQSAVAEEINRNVSNIRNATEETVGAIEQSTVAANDLAYLSSDLQRLVGQFRGV